MLQTLPRWTFALAGCMLVALAAGAAAQTTASKAKRPPAPTGPSTLSGVYTAEQASRGKDVYMGSCKSCHSPESHTGATFAKWWRGKQLSDLFGFVSTKMPKNNPGSLDPGDAADVVAYLLKMNAMPSGEFELYPDVDSLKNFRIETKKAVPTAPGSTTAKRKKP